MAGRIYLSDEYRWSASTELFDWVVRFLRAEVTDPDSRAALAAPTSDLDLRSLPPRGRGEALGALRERLVAALDDGRALVGPEILRRSSAGHVKVLKLMADDLAAS
jgi:hypothetical protein